MSKIAVLVGSVYGAAEELAEHAISELSNKGLECELFNDAGLASVKDFNADAWLIITSTTGQGDVPPNLVDTYQALKDEFPNLSQLKYGIIAMGDSSYHDSFCGAGKQFDALMKELMATSLQEKLEIDACETMEPVEYSANWLNDFIADC
ncbi:flavodoxin [Catenovulum sp. SM1970]|uniref:flavodoxin n=1 Tax=Marinifaba aquimaris TaxID=2741323 RepID=UPI001571CCA0|nr:flavodoxin [Marinifaba aquimaris]NTS77747.1 flavodoxin [Marinifaba aquimaris]